MKDGDLMKFTGKAIISVIAVVVLFSVWVKGVTTEAELFEIKAKFEREAEHSRIMRELGVERWAVLYCEQQGMIKPPE